MTRVCERAERSKAAFEGAGDKCLCHQMSLFELDKGSVPGGGKPRMMDFNVQYEPRVHSAM